jgi:beta-galactosidase
VAPSDHWIDLEQLTFEPTFQKYVRDAFNAVGLMLAFWAETVPAETEQNVKIYVINDLEPEWKGELRLLLLKGTDCVSTRVANCQVKGFGRAIVTIAQTMPASVGDYTLVAELADSQGNTVRSLRDFKIVAPGGAR